MTRAARTSLQKKEVWCWTMRLPTIQDYRNVVEMVLEDGIISPSEDQLLWAMREHLNIDDAYHIQMVMDICGENTLKECTNCGAMAELYPEHAAWYCHACDSWS